MKDIIVYQKNHDQRKPYTIIIHRGLLIVDHNYDHLSLLFFFFFLQYLNKKLDTRTLKVELQLCY